MYGRVREIIGIRIALTWKEALFSSAVKSAASAGSKGKEKENRVGKQQ